MTDADTAFKAQGPPWQEDSEMLCEPRNIFSEHGLKLDHKISELILLDNAYGIVFAPETLSF